MTAPDPSPVGDVPLDPFVARVARIRHRLHSLGPHAGWTLLRLLHEAPDADRPHLDQALMRLDAWLPEVPAEMGRPAAGTEGGGILLPGWNCATCYAFNGTFKEPTTVCRACGAERGVFVAAIAHGQPDAVEPEIAPGFQWAAAIAAAREVVRSERSAWALAIARAHEEAAVAAIPPSAERGGLAPHVLDELGFHPILLSATHRITVLAQAVKEGIVARAGVDDLDAAWATLAEIAPPSFFRRALESLRHKPLPALPVYRAAWLDQRRQEEAWVRGALQQGLLTADEGARGHDEAWTRLGVRVRAADPGSERSRFFDRGGAAPVDRMPHENLGTLALDLQLRGFPVGLVDLCAWSVVRRDVARTWIAEGGEAPPFLARCTACERGEPYDGTALHQDGCVDPHGAALDLAKATAPEIVASLNRAAANDGPQDEGTPAPPPPSPEPVRGRGRPKGPWSKAWKKAIAIARKQTAETDADG